MTDKNKCAHPLCNCATEAGEKYCSEYCRKTAALPELKCYCHHAGCV